jgi:hypothetical protein
MNLRIISGIGDAPIPRRVLAIVIAICTSLGLATPASASVSDGTGIPPASPAARDEGACSFAAQEPYRRRVALEINLLWPVVPGIFEARLMAPILRTDQRDWRGEIVTGAYADYASWLIRDETSGKVRGFAGRIGYRQFFAYGLHTEVSFTLGWRHEEDRPASGDTVFPRDIDGFQTRLWVLAGYQYELSSVLYVNARAGISLNVYRSDAYAYLEKQVVPGGDVNLGVRL